MAIFIADFLLVKSQNVIFFIFLDQNVLYAVQQNCTKYQNFYCSYGGRY